MAELKNALSVVRRMPPALTMKSLAGLTDLAPALTDDLLANVDQPLKVRQDPLTGKEYILCDYNRDGEAYRSPFSNKYFNDDGKEEEGMTLPANLRTMEVEANGVFDVYRKQYFETGYSSVYFFEGEAANSFGATFLIHKDVAGSSSSLKRGSWDSVHVFSVAPTAGGAAGEFEYTLTSSVIIVMALSEDGTGDVDLSGTIVEQVKRVRKTDKFTSQVVNMGTLLEEQETTLRNRIEGIYIQKTREVLSGARSSTGARDKAWADIASSLALKPKA